MKIRNMKFSTIFLFSILLISIICLSLALWKEFNHIAKLEKTIFRKQKNEMLVMDQVTSTLEQVMKKVGRSLIAYPPQLQNIPCSQEMGIVEKITRVKIESIFAPYNAAILEKKEGGYHLFFRYDEPKNSWKPIPFYSYIGYAELDEDFVPGHVIPKINTGSRFSEDPRIVQVGKSLFVSWNDLIDEELGGRSIHVGEWNLKKQKLEYVTSLDQCIKPIEKNWMPFEKKEQGKASLSFVYGISPHKVIDVSNPKLNEVVHLAPRGSSSSLYNFDWAKSWGSLCGGTNARLIGKEYISFFHSSFKENDKVWYVMGAYTFEAKSPHKITSITPYPILFPGIYHSEMINTSDAHKYCIFPSGVAIEKQGDTMLLHVSCGENDAATKIVTINYEKLRSSMIPVK